MKANRTFVLMITALFVLSGFLALMPKASAEPPTKGDYSGDLNSDLRLTAGIHTFDDLTVKAGITLTLEPGVEFRPDPDAYLYIEGTLIVERGATATPTKIGVSGGNDWQGIRVLNFGKVMMENFSMARATGRGISVEGSNAGSTIKNATITGSAEGILYQNTRSSQVLENVLFSSVSNYGIQVRDSTAQISINKVTIRYLAGTGIYIFGSSNVHLSTLEIQDTQSICFNQLNSNNITLDHFNFNDKTSLHQTAGFYFLGKVNDTHISNGVLEGVTFGFIFATAYAERLNITDVKTGNKVGNNIVNTVPQNTGDIKFIDCELRSALNTTQINVNNANFRVDFINTTWYDPMILQGQASVDIYWYLEGEVVDGNGDRIASSLIFNPGPIYEQGTISMVDGYLPKTPIHSGTANNRGTTKLYNDYMFQSQQYPQNMYTLNMVYVGKYTYWTIMLDLDPVHNMPSSLDIQEDIWFDIDLYQYFDDPEGYDLTYNVTTSDNVTIDRVGEFTEGEIRVKNAEKNWFGTGWLIVRATDMGDNSTTANVTINVLPVNDAPYFKTPLPAPVMDEDGWTWVNLTGKIADPENDPIDISFPDGPNYDLEWDPVWLNLTITPSENFNGLLEIEVNLSDGEDWTADILYVIVRSVNDPPTFTITNPDGTAIGMGKYPRPEGPPLNVYQFDIDEDQAVSFIVNATDVDNTNLTYVLDPSMVHHGTIEIDPMNPKMFTYTPLANDFQGDLVRLNVSDGVERVSGWLWFNVSSVNDDPVFDAPDPWEVDVNIGTQFDLELGEMISDVDGDELTISVNPDTFITISGTTLEILVTDAYKETSMEVVVTVTDGTVEVTRNLTIYMENWVETFFETWEVSAKTDKWKVEVAAEEGLDIYLVVEDSDGNRTSYPFIYNDDGEYTAEIPEDIGMEGYSYWISEEEDGEPISGTYEDVLPALKKKDDGGFPWWIIILILVIIILAAAILYFVFARGGGYGGEVGSIDDEE